MPNRNEIQSEVMGAKETAKLLNINVKTLYNLVDEKSIPTSMRANMFGG